LEKGKSPVFACGWVFLKQHFCLLFTGRWRRSSSITYSTTSTSENGMTDPKKLRWAIISYMKLPYYLLR